jgi:PAS domain S-box-containing protein
MEEKPLDILMVEDNLDHIELARRAFEFAYSQDQFYACTTLKEALHWLQDHPVDVIIADLHLPDGSGLDLLNHPQLNGRLPALLITNQGDEQRAVQAIKGGAMDYLVKSPETFRRIPSVAHRVYEQWRVIEAKKAAEEKLRQHEALLNGILQGTRDGYLLIDAEGKILEVNRAYAELVGYPPEELIGKTILDLEALQTPEEIGATLATIRQKGSAYFETCHRHQNGTLIEVEVSVTHLSEHGGKMVTFVRDIRERTVMQIALHQAKDHLERQLEEMTLLRNIDLAIASHQERQAMVEALVEQFVHLKGISGCCLLARGGEKDFWFVQAALPKKFDCQPEKLRDWLPVDLDRLVQEEQPLFVQPNRSSKSSLPPLLANCTAVALLPLTQHGQFLGILVLFSDQAQVFDAEWQDFARAITMQTAIALENVHLYETLSRQHQALLEAYQATLAAWSRTLEIRDKDTEGHTQRVVELGLKLARFFNLTEEELDRFRRGAMLHDIGKIRVPDAILLKPGQLDDKEWEIMRQHPLYAREMVQGIRILEEALEIPLYHHERWDGSGYPYGLKGKEIPLWARIFAVIDVWDALISDRPYRPAWTREVARDYIANQAGRQFDPQVVEAFLKLFDAGEIE